MKDTRERRMGEQMEEHKYVGKREDGAGRDEGGVTGIYASNKEA